MHVNGNKAQGIKSRIKRPKELVGGCLFFGACSRGDGFILGGQFLVSLAIGSPVFSLTGTNRHVGGRARHESGLPLILQELLRILDS